MIMSDRRLNKGQLNTRQPKHVKWEGYVCSLCIKFLSSSRGQRYYVFRSNIHIKHLKEQKWNDNFQTRRLKKGNSKKRSIKEKKRKPRREGIV